jgi:hypothetical protein
LAKYGNIRMAKKSNWLLGCGLGFAGFLALTIFIGIWGISIRREAMRGFDNAAATRRNLEEKYGAAGDFLPAADGSIAPERLEIFLAVRKATQEDRDKISRSFSSARMNEVAPDESDAGPLGEKTKSIFQKLRSAVALGQDIGHLFETRNQALLSSGMGLGEYTYIYVIAYYSWLGHSPGDSPGRNESSAYFTARTQLQRHRDLIRMLSNQLDLAASAEHTEKWNHWRSGLADEIEKMRKNEVREPWENSVPRRIAESLEPFRNQLEQTYSPISNPFELSLPTRQNLFGFRRQQFEIG